MAWVPLPGSQMDLIGDTSTPAMYSSSPPPDTADPDAFASKSESSTMGSRLDSGAAPDSSDPEMLHAARAQQQVLFGDYRAALSASNASGTKPTAPAPMIPPAVTTAKPSVAHERDAWAAATAPATAPTQPNRQVYSKSASPAGITRERNAWKESAAAAETLTVEQLAEQWAQLNVKTPPPSRATDPASSPKPGRPRQPQPEPRGWDMSAPEFHPQQQSPQYQQQQQQQQQQRGAQKRPLDQASHETVQGIYDNITRYSSKSLKDKQESHQRCRTGEASEPPRAAPPPQEERWQSPVAVAQPPYEEQRRPPAPVAASPPLPPPQVDHGWHPTAPVARAPPQQKQRPSPAAATAPPTTATSTGRQPGPVSSRLQEILERSKPASGGGSFWDKHPQPPKKAPSTSTSTETAPRPTPAYVPAPTAALTQAPALARSSPPPPTTTRRVSQAAYAAAAAPAPAPAAALTTLTAPAVSHEQLTEDFWSLPPASTAPQPGEAAGFDLWAQDLQAVAEVDFAEAWAGGPDSGTPMSSKEMMKEAKRQNTPRPVVAPKRPSSPPKPSSPQNPPAIKQANSWGFSSAKAQPASPPPPTPPPTRVGAAVEREEGEASESGFWAPASAQADRNFEETTASWARSSQAATGGIVHPQPVHAETRAIEQQQQQPRPARLSVPREVIPPPSPGFIYDEEGEVVGGGATESRKTGLGSRLVLGGSTRSGNKDNNTNRGGRPQPRPQLQPKPKPEPEDEDQAMASRWAAGSPMEVEQAASNREVEADTDDEAEAEAETRPRHAAGLRHDEYGDQAPGYPPPRQRQQYPQPYPYHGYLTAASPMGYVPAQHMPAYAPYPRSSPVPQAAAARSTASPAASPYAPAQAERRMAAPPSAGADPLYLPRQPPQHQGAPPPPLPAQPQYMMSPHHYGMAPPPHAMHPAYIHPQHMMAPPPPPQGYPSSGGYPPRHIPPQPYYPPPPHHPHAQPMYAPGYPPQYAAPHEYQDMHYPHPSAGYRPPLPYPDTGSIARPRKQERRRDD